MFALMAGLCAVIQFSHLRVEKLAAESQTRAAVAPVIPAPTPVKLMALGYDQLLADVWWLAFIQYFGDTRERLNDHYRYSYRYLDLVTALDPRFIQPYWFAAFSVGAEMKRPDLAARLIDRGLSANQDNWYLPFIAGINQYLFGTDDMKAARYYRQAAKYPDAPRWLVGQAKILESRMPGMLKEIKTWSLIYESANEPMVKATARQNMISRWVSIYRQAKPGSLWQQRAEMELSALGVTVTRQHR